MSNQTPEEIFKEAWLAANARGEQGARVKAGLKALEDAGWLRDQVSQTGQLDEKAIHEVIIAAANEWADEHKPGFTRNGFLAFRVAEAVRNAE